MPVRRISSSSRVMRIISDLYSLIAAASSGVMFSAGYTFNVSSLLLAVSERTASETKQHIPNTQNSASPCLLTYMLVRESSVSHVPSLYTLGRGTLRQTCCAWPSVCPVVSTTPCFRSPVRTFLTVLSCTPVVSAISHG